MSLFDKCQSGIQYYVTLKVLSLYYLTNFFVVLMDNLICFQMPSLGNIGADSLLVVSISGENYFYTIQTLELENDFESW